MCFLSFLSFLLGYYSHQCKCGLFHVNKHSTSELILLAQVLSKIIMTLATLISSKMLVPS